MFKKSLLKIALVISSAFLFACSQETDVSKQFKLTEGVHYTVLKTPLDRPKNEVLEFFWYGCPHCYDAEPHIKSWAKEKGSQVTLTQIHSLISPRWVFDKAMYFLFDSLGSKGEKLHSIYFDDVHSNQFKSEQDVKDWFVYHKLDYLKMQELLKNPEIKNRNKEHIALERSINSKGVPALVVGGKYMVNLNGLSGVGGWKGVGLILDSLILLSQKSIDSK